MEDLSMKRYATLLAILIMLLAAATAFAASPDSRNAEVYSVGDTVTSDLSSDGLFECYVNWLFGGADSSLESRNAGDALTGYEKQAYDALLPMINAVANGTSADGSTEFRLDLFDGMTADVTNIASSLQELYGFNWE